MDTRPASRRLKEHGVTSVQFLLASGLGLIVFLLLANLIVVQYGRGAIRSALDQGVRVGSVSGSTLECERRIGEVLGQLLGGSMGEGVVVSCRVGAETVTAQGRAVFEAWTPFTPAFTVELSAAAAREVAP